MAKSDQASNWNFCFPIDPSRLRNDRLRLVPFDSSIDLFAHHYVLHTSKPAAAENFRYLPYGPFADVSTFLKWYNKFMKASDAILWFAILVSETGAESLREQRRIAGVDDQNLDTALEVRLDEVGSGPDPVEVKEYFAGSIGYLHGEFDNAACEIGHINILPTFQRTFVTTNAVALLLNHLLDPPLSLRRVTWLANSLNGRSMKAAERLGFRLEGILRWQRILAESKEGAKVESDDRGPGRDSAVFSICWDDWRDGVKANLQKLMDR